MLQRKGINCQVMLDGVDVSAVLTGIDISAHVGGSSTVRLTLAVGVELTGEVASVLTQFPPGPATARR